MKHFRRDLTSEVDVHHADLARVSYFRDGSQGRAIQVSSYLKNGFINGVNRGERKQGG